MASGPEKRPGSWGGPVRRLLGQTIMKQRRQDFALGLAVMVFVVLFVVTLLFLYPVLQAGGRAVEIHFRHEDGMAPLKAGSPVLLAGSLEVGRVRAVRVEELDAPATKGGRKRTVFVVQAELREDIPLYGNCEITSDQPAIGGSGFVSILNVGTPDVPLAGPIQGLPPQSLSATIGALSRRLLAAGGLVDQLSRVVDSEAEGSLLHKLLVSLDDVNAMTRELRAQMSPDQQEALLYKLHRVLDEVNATTAGLRAELSAGNDAALVAKLHLALTHLDEGLSEAAAMLKENRPVIRSTLATVEHAVRTVDQDVLAVLQSELDPANPTGTLGKLHTAMDRVNASLADVRSMTAAGQRMVVLSRPALEKTLENFQGMSEQLRLASQEVLLNPSKLIWGPSREREEKLLVFRAASNFAEAASQLDQAAGRLEAVLKALPADGRAAELDTREIESVYQAVQAAFQRFDRAEQVLWEQLK
jgi:ABC-type transporter Mla subunit MlaD